MVYNFTLLTSKSDCDMLIAITNKTKADLEFRKLSLQRQRESATDNTVDIDAELQAINAELGALQSVVGTLPDGKSKDDAIRDIKRLEYRKFVFEDRKNNYGVVSLMEKEYDIGCIEKQIEETDAFITAVKDRKEAI